MHAGYLEGGCGGSDGAGLDLQGRCVKSYPGWSTHRSSESFGCNAGSRIRWPTDRASRIGRSLKMESDCHDAVVLAVAHEPFRKAGGR